MAPSTSLFRLLTASCLALSIATLGSAAKGQQPNSDASKSAVDKAIEKKHVRIGVTHSTYDNIGSVLRAMQIPFQLTAITDEPMKEFNCIFLGCASGESSKFPPDEVQQFVQRGGVLYVSDLSYTVLQAAFPKQAQGWTKGGQVGVLNCVVLDKKLAKEVGGSIALNFDAPGWAAALEVGRGVDVLVAYEQAGRRLPVLFSFKYGKGRVVYTSFHNHANANALEQKLIRALVQAPLKAAQEIQSGLTSGTDIEALKEKARGKPLEEGSPARPAVTASSVSTFSIDALLTAFDTADRSQQELILQELHDRKGGQATAGLVRAIAAAEEDDLKSSARDLLAKRLERMTEATLARYLAADSDAELQIAAAEAATARQEQALVPALVELLGDSHRPAADAAHRALTILTGENFGPFIDAKTDQRFVTARKWKDWLAER